MSIYLRRPWRHGGVLAASLLMFVFLFGGASYAESPESPESPALGDKTAAITPPAEGDTKAAESKKPTHQETEAEKGALEQLNVLWTLLAAILVFFMQAGFAMVESGFTRAKNACNIMMKNLMDFSIGSLSFWLVGFGLMFGVSAATGGWIGTNNFLFDATVEAPLLGKTVSFGWAFLIFQTVFCATAATIVSGAMAERTKFTSYLIYSIGITAIVYPIFGSWAWGGLWAGTEVVDRESVASGWLAKKGFLDFAGSTVVHSVGGWCALAGAIVLGPRIGKYKSGKSVPIPGHNIPLAALGVFILWMGWFGFNAGSMTTTASIFDENTGSFVTGLASIAVMTNLAAAAGAVGAMVMSWIMFKKPDPSFALNGALAGLVSITAGCDGMNAPLAALTGLIGGFIVVAAVIAFDRCKIDDPVGAISVHGVCGAWGTLAVGIYGTGVFWVQLLGVVAAFAWAFPVSFGFFHLIKATVGLRASEQEEMEGLDLSEHGMYAYPPIFVADPVGGTPLTPAGWNPAAMPAPSYAAAKPATEGA